jgi:hypothetical protein
MKAQRLNFETHLVPSFQTGEGCCMHTSSLAYLILTEVIRGRCYLNHLINEMDRGKIIWLQSHNHWKEAV